MKNKQLVLDNLERLRNNIKNINYQYSTGAAFQDFKDAVEAALETLGKAEDLVNVEHDFFRTNQII